MPAPYPYEAVAGRAVDPAEAEAINLYRQYGWLARLSEEMNAAANLDLKKTMQIVRHARQYRRWYDALQLRGATARDQIEGFLLVKKCRWATRVEMAADLLAIYDGALTLADGLDANVPEYKTGWSTNIINPEGNQTDMPIMTTKSPAVGTLLSRNAPEYACAGPISSRISRVPRFTVQPR